MKKLVYLLLLSVLIGLCITRVAIADVYYAPQPSTVYVAPNPYFVAGQQLGSALGQIAANAQLRRAQKQLQEGTDGSAIFLANSAVQYSIQQIDQMLKQYAFNSGGQIYSSMQGNTYIAQVTQNVNGFARNEEYVIDYNLEKVRVIVEIASVGLRAVSVKPIKW